MATQLASKNVVGRDRLIRQIWKMLRKNSIVFTAERRIGKTTVMQKMEAEAPDGIIATYLDLEKIDTPHRFVEVLLDEVKGLLPKTRKARNAFAGLLNGLNVM
jgi:AAA+ ATPase superfamily predicted ATPase